MNVEHLEKVENGDKGSVNLYLIKWQPLGGKPGGCITCNQDGTFSTPICNLTDNSQKWIITNINVYRIKYSYYVLKTNDMNILCYF